MVYCAEPAGRYIASPTLTSCSRPDTRWDRARSDRKRGNLQYKAVSMGKYKQWLHHQEVGARLRDEIAAHEAERERVLKLAPTRSTTLPELSNPIIAALLGQGLVSTAEPSAAKNGTNGASAASVTTVEVVAAASATTTAEAGAAEMTMATTVEEAEEVSPAAAPADDSKTVKAAKQKTAGPATNGKEKPASPSSAGEARPVVAPAAQADTIDPMLAQLLAQAESTPADPLEALNLLASQGPNLTHGEAPQAITAVPTAPLISATPVGQSAISVLMGETRATAESSEGPSASVTAPIALSVEAAASAEVSARAEATARGEKGRSETDELVAARPTEGYTEPRLIVPQWLKSMELGQEQEGEKAEATEEDAEARQRFSVSLPFENEEDMRLHESVERWWQRWRQQS